MPWILATIGLMLLAAVLLTRAVPYRIRSRSLASPVTRQHLHLLEGGELGIVELESARRSLQRHFSHAPAERTGELLRAGLEFAPRVHALVESGHRGAAEVLACQLSHRISSDPTEQAWYWLDVARGLRRLRSPETMTALLRCPALAADSPLNHHYAAEIACCPGFRDALTEPIRDIRRAATRALALALRSVRWGAAPDALGEGRLGEAVVKLWRRRLPPTEPGIVAVFLEALRISHRSDHLRIRWSNDTAINRVNEAQLESLLSIREGLNEFLADAPAPLMESLVSAGDDRRSELLAALDDLRADAAAVVLPNLRDWPDEHRRRAIELLRWSPSPEIGRWLCDWTFGSIDPVRRALGYSVNWPWRRRSLDSSFPYWSILHALRGQPCAENETLLLIAAADRDPRMRAAALGSLGWQPPIEEWAVHRTLQSGRADRDHDVRSAAEAALARLGERRALQSLRAALAGETERAVTDTVQFIAREQILWLWPDLDALADSDDLDVALAARDALEQMRENVGGGMLVL